MSQTKAQLIDNLVQPITGALGSASAPTFSFTADPNTGLFSPGADQLSLSTGGTGRLFINSTGQTSLGTASALSGATLTIAGNGLAITGQNLAHSANSLRMGEEGSGLAELRAYGPDVSTAGSFRFRVSRSDGSNSSDIVIDSSGRLGIGTSSPAELVHLLSGSGSDCFLRLNSTSSANNSGIRWQSGGVARGIIASDGAFGGSTADFGILAEAGLSFYTNGTTTKRMVLDTSGRVGIGTTSPLNPLHIAAAIPIIRLQDTDGGRVMISCPDGHLDFEADSDNVTANSRVSFKIDDTERARIDSSGRLLVGTSSARSNFFNLASISPRLQLEGASSSATDNGRFLSHTFGRNADSEPMYIFAKHRSESVGGIAAVQSGDFTGTISFQGSDGTEFVEAANISAVIDGTPGANDMPGRLVFSTTADGASSPTEALRIDNQRRAIFNGATGLISAINNGVLYASGATCALFQATGGASTQVGYFWNNATASNNLFIEFGTETSITTRGSIDYNRAAGQVRYNVTSDRRLKSDIQPAPTAIDALSAIQVRSYKWAETGYQVDHGFIAQELNEVAPDAVKVGDDGEEVTDTWAVDNGKLVPLLTKALQEAIGEIESLKARLTAAGI